MATYGTGHERKFYREELTCDACNSKNVQEHALGHVCNDCGIVLEHAVLAYYQPYKEGTVQHAILGGTTMGTRQERRAHSNSIHFNKLNKLHSIQETEKAVNFRARREIKRIFGHLNLPASKIEMTMSTFKEFRSKLQAGTKYRSPEKLVPVAIFTIMKLHNISINESALLDISTITKKEFNAFKFQISRFMPQYATRNRKDYILQKIMEVREHFSLGMTFYYTAKAILYRLWKSINCTKDDVIAGLACSITVLCCCQERDDITVNAICKKLGIMMSTIQSQVKNNIVGRFKIPNFESLVKSTDILKKVLVALNIIEPEPISLEMYKNEDDNAAHEIITSDIIQIMLTEEGTKASFQGEEGECYHFVVKDVNDNPVFMEIKTKVGRKLENLIEKKKSRKKTRSLLFEFNRYRYYRSKGPPAG